MNNTDNTTVADGANTQATQQEEQKTFTQDELNRIISDRLTKEKSRLSSELEQREQELQKKEFNFAARDKLAEKGYTVDLLEVLNCSDMEGLEKSLSLLDKQIESAIKKREDDNPNKVSFGLPPVGMSAYDFGSEIPLRNAMGLNKRRD